MDYLTTYNAWLNDERLDADSKAELLSIKGNDSEIMYRFGASLKFGTAGMRGFIGVGTNMMNVYTVKRATLGLSKYILGLGEDAVKRGVAISYDTRRKSQEFALAAAGVLIDNGIKVYLYKNPRPVPVLSFAVRKLGCISGIMITASHNPKEYNGYKVYGEDGAQMSPEATKVVVSYIEEINDYLSVEGKKVDIDTDTATLSGDGVHLLQHDFEELYYAEIVKLGLSPEAVKNQGKGIKLVYTPVHGTGYEPVMTVLSRMGINANVVAAQVNPDTEFSTVEVPNPEYRETLSMGIDLANEIGADVVFGTDPDCDRLGVALRNNQNDFVALSGNQVGVLMLNYILTRLKEDGKLRKDSFAVKSFVSTGLAKAVADDFNVEIKETPVGFKFIGEKIKQSEESGIGDFVFGFEESCGYLRGTHARDKDAVVASMLFAELVCYYNEKGVSVFEVLEGIYQKYGYFLDKTISIAFKGLTAMDEMNAAIDGIRNTEITRIGTENVVATRDYLVGERVSFGRTEKLEYSNLNCIYFELESGGFVCLRPSGTEPKLKIYYSVKGDTQDIAEQKFTQVSNAFATLMNN